MAQPDVYLRHIEYNDLPLLRRWRNLPVIYKWCRQFEPISESHHLSWFDSIRKDPTIKMYSILNDELDIIGACGLTSIDYINSRAEFSLYIGPEHQGQGYGEASLRALCSFGFNVLNLNCIWGEAFVGNPALDMFKKVGFKEEGARREFYFREGKYIDAILFSLLRSDYGL